MSDKERADVALVRRGLCESREKAQAAIMAGQVYKGENRVMKASDPVRPEESLSLRGQAIPWVSRGALKLEKALRVFDADLTGHTVMDIGASTGGFTEVSLKAGAARVYAIDVGYGQLDWKLRNDPRVSVMERTNARYLKREQFSPVPDVTVMDVSFISIRLILPAAIEIMGDHGVFYTLIKPQFEAGREKVGKKGVIRDPAVHEEVITEIRDFAESLGWRLVHLDFSPITGQEGNIEFLAEIRKADSDILPMEIGEIRRVIGAAHGKLIPGANCDIID